MSVAGGLIAQIAIGLLAVLAALVTGGRIRSRAVGTLCAALGLTGAVTGAAVLAGASGSVEIPTALPLVGVLDPLTLAPDQLGGVFMLVAGIVGAACATFGIGYAAGPAASRTGWAAFATFLLGLQLVPAAGDVVTFLLAWELMALGSTALVLADQRVREAARSAGLWYAVMTHLSMVCLLAGFAILAAAAGGTSLTVIASASVDGTQADIAFVLLVLGFATKAGLVPLHVWLPRAHPQAPSHASALMSAAMVKMGVYGVLLVVLDLLPAGPSWWGLLVLTLGAVSALYGILQASVQPGLKRLLAYSTTENVGLMFAAAGFAMLLDSAGQVATADVAWVSVLLLMVSHAAFKTVLFLAAGSVIHSTGEGDLDRLGGLSRAMPVTSVTFAIAALGAAALPISSGFVAEWVLLQSMIHTNSTSGRLLAAVAPVTLGVIALTAGLALLTFVKAYGIGFLARPRSIAAIGAHDPGWAMKGSLVAGAGAVVALGLAPGPVAGALAGAVGASGVQAVGWFGLSLPAVSAQLDPVALSLFGLLLVAPVLVVTWALARSRPRQAVELAWGCGGVRDDPRMQYTATSYAEPLVRVFDDALQPARDVEVSHAGESSYMVERVEFAQDLVDVTEVRMYRPITTGAGRLGRAARGLQNGSIHRYLAYSFFALLVVLVVVTW